MWTFSFEIFRSIANNNNSENMEPKNNEVSIFLV